ncbi:MAG: hypothetical protein MUF54_06245 [Polyangiaceae bacterium]|nr:hypothetical protein [Polyangiaceae bacterium]
MRTSMLIALLAIGAVSACRASVNVDAKTSAKEPSEPSASPTSQALSGPTAVPATDYFGVARRLTLTARQREPVCACVAAHVGNANDPDFDWHGKKPAVGPDALVVAVGSHGAACDSDGRGPSVAAIEQSNHDVIVVLEEFRDSRPVAFGAIVPNPGPEGGIYLRARGQTRFGRPLNGTSGTLCRVGTGTAGAAVAGPSGQPVP